jgi:protein gp37
LHSAWRSAGLRFALFDALRGVQLPTLKRALADPVMQEEFRRFGLLSPSNNGPTWNGKIQFDRARLREPLERKAPAIYSLCPFGDLFHEGVQTKWLDAIFDVMEHCRHHVFHLLTKRANRMMAYILSRYSGLDAPAHIAFSVSCENQRAADERIPASLETPAVVRYVQLFPLLGPIDLSAYLGKGSLRMIAVGEEPERPANPAWIESIRQQCAEAGIGFVVSNRLVGEPVVGSLSPLVGPRII